MFKQKVRTAFIFIVLFSGCSSLAIRATTTDPQPYPGTREDFSSLRKTFFGDENGKYDGTNWIGLPFVLADLPCSLAFDTLIYD